MKRIHAWFVVQIAAGLLAAGTAGGQVWHASAGFSQTQNPNGQWSYGWTQTLGGTFNLMTGQSTFCTTPAWNAPAVSNYLVVQKNVLPVPKTCGAGTYQPLGLIIHPGPAGERSVVRWTAPAAGACSISAAFPGVSLAPSSDVAILHNASVLGAAPVTTYATGPIFFFAVAVQAGDTIDLLAGDGSNGYVGDATGLLATVTLNVVSTGPGCGVSPPVLHATPLPLGNTAALSIANAVPSTPGILFASPLATSALPMGAGCFAYLDLAALTQLFNLTTDATGSWSLTVPVPADPLLAGAQFALQAVLLPTAAPLGVDLSNGIVVTLGT